MSYNPIVSLFRASRYLGNNAIKYAPAVATWAYNRGKSAVNYSTNRAVQQYFKPKTKPHSTWGRGGTNIYKRRPKRNFKRRYRKYK